MKIKKQIEISESEILEYFISCAEECTIAEARDILKRATVTYDIKESGDFDRGNYNVELNSIDIEY